MNHAKVRQKFVIPGESRSRANGGKFLRMLALLPFLNWIDPGIAGDLEVRIEAVRDAAGGLKVMLFDREDGFRKEDKALRVLALPAAAGTVTGRFQGLPAGRYAVVAYHDENGDGKLNLRFGMFPKEGYGLSNNPKVSGPPKFKDAAFDIGDGENHIVIRLAY